VDALNFGIDTHGAEREGEGNSTYIRNLTRSLLALEPAVTPLSWIVYRFFHVEPVRLDQDPLADATHDPDRDPYDSNSAIPTLLFDRDRERLARACPGLVVRDVQRFSSVAYPLSGASGRGAYFLPTLVTPMLRLDRVLERALGRLMAFRLLAVLEKV
jgi:hypothetical protein